MNIKVLKEMTFIYSMLNLLPTELITTIFEFVEGVPKENFDKVLKEFKDVKEFLNEELFSLNNEMEIDFDEERFGFYFTSFYKYAQTI